MRGLTGDGNYFEDFTPGEVLIHTRGRTLGDSEHLVFTSQVLNTAQIHFNQALVEGDPAMREQFGGRRPVVGPYVLAVVMGLASPDTTENALAIVGLEEARHMEGVFAGDTLFARTEVLGKREAGSDRGVVKFRITGLKQDKATVAVEAVYEVMVRKRGKE